MSTFNIMKSGFPVGAIRRMFLGMLAALLLPAAAAGAHGAGGHRPSAELGMSVAYDRMGRLWAVSKESSEAGQFVMLRMSADEGRSWSAPRRVHPQSEPVAAGGEARPHIAFGAQDEIYISYTRTVARPHIGDIRFVRSVDGGKTFSPPITAHADREVVVHSFESMVVDRDGKIFLAWIDGRDAARAKAGKTAYAGSAVYYAVSDDKGASFRGDYRIADHACECCRIGLTQDEAGKVVAMWRHVFAPNIRDHAIATLTADGRPAPLKRATFDDWRVDACPHAGPSIAFAKNGARHQVWFNGKEGPGGGALYALVKPGATEPGPAVTLGSAQASHPDVAVSGDLVGVVWKQFDGKSTAVMARLSLDGGASWSESEVARTEGDSDKPFIIASPHGLALTWNTANEGVRVLQLKGGKS